MADRPGKYEPTSERVEGAGKGALDDEMLPDEGRPVEQSESGGETMDTAGQHGDMAVESAKGLDKTRRQ